MLVFGAGEDFRKLGLYANEAGFERLIFTCKSRVLSVAHAISLSVRGGVDGEGG